MLAARLGTETGSGNAVHGAMGLVRLPLAGPVTQQRALLIRERLLDLGTDAPVNEVEGSAWLRVSAQAYNTMADFKRLGALIEKALEG